VLLIFEAKHQHFKKISLVNIWICHVYVFFGLKLHETADLVPDLDVYKVKEEALPSGLFVIEVDDLLMSSVMHIYKHEGCMYICPREDPDQRSLTL